MRTARLLLCLLAILAIAGVSPRSAAEAKPEEAPLWERCLDAVPWFHAVHTPNMETRLLELAMSSGLAKWSDEWIKKAIADAPSLAECLAEAKKQDKLLFWYVPSIAGQQMILPHFLDRYVSTGMLSDPEVVSVLSERCVCLKLPVGGRLARRVGLTAPQAIEPAFLLIDPNGKVLWKMDRVQTFDGAWFLRTLAGALPAEPAEEEPMSVDALRAKLRPDPGPKILEFTTREIVIPMILGRIRQALWRGDHSNALTWARLVDAFVPTWRDAKPRRLPLPKGEKEEEGSLTLGDVFYEVARVYRRTARVDDAAKAIAWAAVVGERTRVHPGDIAAEAGRIAVLRRELADAARLFGAPDARDVEAPRAAEAAYWLGVTQYLRGEEEAARKAWRRAVELGAGEEQSPGLWAAKASACLAEGTDRRPGESPVVRAMYDPRLPDTSRPGTQIQQIRRRALDFLLTQQRKNGMFWGPRWGGGKPDEEPKPFSFSMEIAITALAASAIHAFAKDDPKRAKDALKRAESWLLGEPTMMRGDAPVWVYSDAFRLLHFARRMKGLDSQARKRATRKMKDWIKHLVEHQGGTGGPFKHFTYTSTFVTACVKHCLHAADDAGFDVPAEVYTKADKAILSARDAGTGFYGYLLDHPHATRDRLGAAQRQPLCDYALYLSKQADKARLRKAVAVYLDAYPDSAALSRTSNFHIPSLGSTAGYYFWHDFYYACLAAREGGTAEQRAALLELWVSLPEPDGSFVDAGMSYGKAYGTAMALLSLEVLTKGG